MGEDKPYARRGEYREVEQRRWRAKIPARTFYPQRYRVRCAAAARLPCSDLGLRTGVSMDLGGVSCSGGVW